MSEEQDEIAAISAQIENLCQERATLAVELDLPSDEPPLAIAEAYRRQARENPQLFAEIKGIDEAIAVLEKQLEQKHNRLYGSSSMTVKQPSILEQLESAKIEARVHAERINELAKELSAEIRSLKACADELSPLYWQVYYKPFISGFKTISVPHVRSDGEVWTIVNRIV